MTNSTLAAEVETEAASEIEGERRLAKASRIVSSSAGWSAGAGLIPLPFVDLAALAALQVKMIGDLSDIYGQPWRREAVRSVVSVLLGVLLPSQATSLVAGSGVKMIPVVGSVVGAVSLSAFGAAASYAIGKIFIRHFEAGGTLENFNPARVEDELKEEFKAAKAKAEPA